MFYIKTEIAEGVTIHTEIKNDNVFTICPDCGVEHQAYLKAAIINDEELDLYGVRVCCSKCSAKYRAEHDEGHQIIKASPDDVEELIAVLQATMSDNSHTLKEIAQMAKMIYGQFNMQAPNPQTSKMTH